MNCSNSRVLLFKYYIRKGFYVQANQFADDASKTLKLHVYR